MGMPDIHAATLPALSIGPVIHTFTTPNWCCRCVMAFSRIATCSPWAVAVASRRYGSFRRSCGCGVWVFVAVLAKGPGCQLPPPHGGRQTPRLVMLTALTSCFALSQAYRKVAALMALKLQAEFAASPNHLALSRCFLPPRCGVPGLRCWLLQSARQCQREALPGHENGPQPEPAHRDERGVGHCRQRHEAGRVRHREPCAKTPVLQCADARAACPASVTGRALSLFTLAMFLGVAAMQWFTGWIGALALSLGLDPYIATLTVVVIAGLLVTGAVAFMALPAPPTSAAGSKFVRC